MGILNKFLAKGLLGVQAGGRNEANRAPWITPYMIITVTACFATIGFTPPPEGLARYHTQTGQAEEILVIICT